MYVKNVSQTWGQINLEVEITFILGEHINMLFGATLLQ